MENQAYYLQKLLVDKLDSYKGKEKEYAEEYIKEIQDAYKQDDIEIKELMINKRIQDEEILLYKPYVVATTRQNGTHSLLTSAKLSVGYLVVGITRELDKEPSLYYPLYIYMASGPCYNNIYLALKSMYLPHVLLLIHMCFP